MTTNKLQLILSNPTEAYYSLILTKELYDLYNKYEENVLQSFTFSKVYTSKERLEITRRTLQNMVYKGEFGQI